jgi:uncharacterized protein (TIGR03083 family)
VSTTTDLDRGAVYNETRARISELVRDLDEGAAVTPVPACPSWTVKDVVAHVTGVCADILGGKLEGVATDPWTQAQVDARTAKPIAEIVAEWDEVGAQVEAILASFPPAAASQLVFDLVTHEHDIRGALRVPGARDSGGVAIGAEFGVLGLQLSVGSHGLPPLRVVAGDQPLGEDGGATLTAEPFEVMRACSGRRCPDQLRAMKWEGDADAYLPAFTFGPFAPRPDVLDE